MRDLGHSFPVDFCRKVKNICCLLLSRIVYTECVIPSWFTFGSLFVV